MCSSERGYNIMFVVKRMGRFVGSHVILAESCYPLSRSDFVLCERGVFNKDKKKSIKDLNSTPKLDFIALKAPPPNLVTLSLLNMEVVGEPSSACNRSLA